MRTFPHTFTASHLLLSPLQGQQMEKRQRREEGESNTKHERCCWTWPVSNRHSFDRWSMFTKQTGDTNVKKRKMVTWGCMSCEKKPGIQAGISLRALKAFQRDEKTACHTRTARVSRRMCLMLLAPSIPGISGCLPRPSGVTGTDRQLLSLLLCWSDSTWGQKETLLASQSSEITTWTCRTRHEDFRCERLWPWPFNKSNYTQPST